MDLSLAESTRGIYLETLKKKSVKSFYELVRIKQLMAASQSSIKHP